MKIKNKNLGKSVIESLEARIAPAALVTYPKPVDAKWLPLPLGTPVELFAGQGLSTLGDQKGSYLLFVEQGSAIVFTQDLDGDNTFDANEITGIAAGDGLRLISFVDIHGDIVTNLKVTTVDEIRDGVVVPKRILSLSDSDNNPANDVAQGLKGDGRVLLNNTIEKIELRPLLLEDLVDQTGDGVVTNGDLALRQPPKSTFSIYGSIYAGRGFGADDGGLIFNPTGVDSTGNLTQPAPTNFLPAVDSIRIGTAVSGQYYSFGVSGEYQIGRLSIGDNLSGVMSPFVPAFGAAGGSINGVKSLGDNIPFNINFLVAGNGGAGAAGGNISNVAIISDDTGGYQLLAGNGGTGRSGGDGGSIINFSDTGSQTGLVVLSGGDGGRGTIGNGGTAGDSSFANLSIRGNVHVDMGDGGNGFVNGGGGASLATGVFTEPDPTLTRTLNGWGTTHLPDSSSGGYNARLGVTAGIDFNGDGEGDFVYVTGGALDPSSREGNSQIIVMISDPLADTDPDDTGFITFTTPDGLPIQGIYLSGPRNAKALSVGDVNGDGHPDIVAASRDFGGTGDLQVMLCKYEDLNNDGILSSDEDLNRNGVDDFIGFYEPRHSTIPFLGNHEGSVGLSPGRLVIPEYNEFGVNDLAIGDFNGDGIPEIAVGAYELAVYMQPDFELNPVTGEKEYTGQFFYDYGTKTATVDGVKYLGQPKNSYFDTDAMFVSSAITFAPTFPYFPVVLEASTLSTVGDTQDYLLISAWSFDAVAVLDWSDQSRLQGGVPVYVGQQYELGVVDLDRGPGVNLAPFRLFDFTTVDFDGDGDMDVAAISLDSGNHSGFMNGSVGTGTGSGLPGSGTGNQAGNYLASPDVGHRSLYTIRAGDIDGVGGLNDLVISHETGGAIVTWRPGPNSAGRSYFSDGSINGVTTNNGDQGLADSNHSFADSYVSDVNSTEPTHIFAFGFNDTFAPVEPIPRPYDGHVQFFATAGFVPGPAPIPYLEYSLSIAAGNGGHALIGKGGVGGFIGGVSTLEPLVDVNGAPVLDAVTGLPVQLLNGAIKITPTVTVSIVSGIGGDGFSSGGNGGLIQGVSIYETDGPYLNRFLNHRLTAGDGGRGVFGTGGNGGSLVSNSVWGGVEFLAGNGGVGKNGGNGGSVTGNGGTYDAYNSSVAVIAGDGGLGSSSGGAGGSIAGFHPRLPDPRIADAPTATLPVEPVPTVPPVPAFLRHYLYYRAGDGGSAVTGRGGNGGNISSSSPTIGVQLLGELIINAGDGGIGNSGGNGGSISDFAIRPDGGSGTGSNDLFPKLVSVLAGRGGDAFSGKGGNGGNLTNIDVIGKGSDTVGTNSIQSIYRVYQDASRFQFNRVIAGAGGSSAANDGGNGGALDNIVAFSPAGSFAIIGGAAGDGLRKGGTGGSVLNLRIDIGTQSVAKALIAAGAGGDASSFVLNPFDQSPNQALNSFGGKVGKGGNGGSVLGVTLQGSRDAKMDIIAGDGGSTVNYGTVRDGKKGFVGVGGSVKQVYTTGDLGNGSEFVALRSYNDVLNGESFGDFVQSDLIDQTAVIGAPLVTLDDNVGNVGIIVGSAGRNKAVRLDAANNPTIYRSIPSQAGINGTLENVTALNLAAAVAGSVDRIAAIQSYKNVLITNNTGSGKTPRLVMVPGGLPTIVEDYADEFGIPTSSHQPVLDGILVDGAIVAKRFLNARGKNVEAPINGFPR